MAAALFYGELRHPPMLTAVLDRQAETRPVSLFDKKVLLVIGSDDPVLVTAPGVQAQGRIAPGLSERDLARIDFYEEVCGRFRRAVDVGGRAAQLWTAGLDQPVTGPDWSLDAWVARWGDIAVATAHDVMALFGQVSASAVAARREAMLVRGASRVRAGAEGPVTLRHAAGPGDVTVARQRQPYAGYFAVEEYDLTFRRFDGSASPAVTRAVFISGDAVTVLPYDPPRDRVLLIEQFRSAPFARGDRQPWLLEAIAGRIDPGETPQEAARREATEEAGLALGALLPVASYYPTPGAKAEYLYSYVALTDLPDGAAGVFGLASEAEDIRGHLVSFDRLMALVASGEVDNAPLLLSALWLQRERPRLRAGDYSR